MNAPNADRNWFIIVHFWNINAFTVGKTKLIAQNVESNLFQIVTLVDTGIFNQEIKSVKVLNLEGNILKMVLSAKHNYAHPLARSYKCSKCGRKFYPNSRHNVEQGKVIVDLMTERSIYSIYFQETRYIKGTKYNELGSE